MPIVKYYILRPFKAIKFNDIKIFKVTFLAKDFNILNAKNVPKLRHVSFERANFCDQDKVKFCQIEWGLFKKNAFKGSVMLKIKGIQHFLPPPPPGKPKILSKLFELGPPKSLQIKLYQKFYPPFPRDAPEG